MRSLKRTHFKAINEMQNYDALEAALAESAELFEREQKENADLEQALNESAKEALNEGDEGNFEGDDEGNFEGDDEGNFEAELDTALKASEERYRLEVEYDEQLRLILQATAPNVEEKAAGQQRRVEREEQKAVPMRAERPLQRENFREPAQPFVQPDWLAEAPEADLTAEEKAIIEAQLAYDRRDDYEFEEEFRVMYAASLIDQ